MFKLKQARKGFRPTSAMKGMGYFQNLRNFLDIFWIFLGIFWKFFKIFLKEFLWRNFLEKFFGGIFLEELFGRNSLFTLLKLFEYERD